MPVPSDQSRFNRFVHEMLHGCVERNSFEPWEVELLVAFQEYDYDRATKRQLLRRYQRAVNRGIETGANPPHASSYLASHPRSG